MTDRPVPAPAGLAPVLALYCPDIAQNTGTCLRTGACLGVPVHLIEPAGFPVGSAAFRRAGMDYLDVVDFVRHPSFAAFDAWRQAQGRRLVLFTTKGATPYHRFAFQPGDVLLFGRESAGAPPEVHDAADARVVIPLRPGLRSLNVAVSAGIAVAEALRQTGALPEVPSPPEAD
ncbi:tRNA (cytidine(34)-2'-O)-methyltransferase [Aquabacter cavernae]|uniref:tRNA (cytidine(34)-2'-O)-methyltransferase n=1 Tax=Aquabacter cavernae TaxID=2496029 RepID=UPI001FDEBDFD|nr:tRNA (cytidine(34)-2'-O)-methyltransferase [Aquabacter cavernae]